jgi:hypothetical protein
MRADDDSLRRRPESYRLDSCFEIADGAAVNIIDLRHDIIAERRESLLDIGRGGFERLVMPDIMRLAGNGGDVLLQAGGEFDFLGRGRRQRAFMCTSRHI